MVILHKGSTLFYTQHGHGPEHLLLFHGFGQDHRAFDSWIEPLAHTHTLYLFDLYYHGQSTWPETDRPVQKEDWQAVIQTILDAHQVDHFSVAGYSLGARFALAAAETFAAKTRHIFLIAPDGIATNPWYALATSSAAGRILFNSMITRHKRFLSVAGYLQSLRLVHPNLVRFAAYQMSTEEKRSRVYASWVVFRALRFSLQALAARFNAHHISVTMVAGRHDPVIRAEGMPRFLKLLQRHHLEILDGGHHGLIARSLPFVQAALTPPPPVS
jgi:pimeloyl-ACP methyl ester carboxylesterase